MLQNHRTTITTNTNTTITTTTTTTPTTNPPMNKKSKLKNGVLRVCVSMFTTTKLPQPTKQQTTIN